MMGAFTFRGAELWPVALAAAIVAALAVALYPAQVRALGGAWRWVLPGLRALAAAALALSILRPVLVWTPGAEDGAVLVLVDRSMSMGAKDRLLSEQRAPGAVVGQLISIADTLGWLPELPQRQQASALHDQLGRLHSLAEDIGRARRELAYARLSGREPGEAEGRLRNAVVQFLAVAADAEEAARNMALPQEALGKVQRLRLSPDQRTWPRTIEGLRDAVAEAQSALEQFQNAADERTYRQDASVRAVCDELSRLSRLQLSWLVLTAHGGLLDRLPPALELRGLSVGAALSPMALSAEEAASEADAPRSDLTGAVLEALAQRGRRPIEAVVLVSDGRQVGADPSRPQMLAGGPPVYALYAAAPRLRDLSIQRVEMPSAVFVNEVMNVRVVFHSSDLAQPAAMGEVVLAGPHGPPLVRPISLRRGQVAPVEFSLRMQRPGLQRIDITVSEQDGEASAVNNRVTRWVKVLPQRLKVSLIAGSPGWDYRALRDILATTPWIDARSSVLPPAGSAVIADGEQHDLLILSEVPQEALAGEQWEAIARLVRQHGGSLLIIPPLSMSPPGPILSELLPYSPQLHTPGWRQWPGRTPAYHIAPADEDAAAALRLDDDPEVSRQRWDELPAFFRYLSLGQLKPGARALLVERDSLSPLLTEMRLGAGRVFFLGIHETWRWGDWVGPRDLQRFWQQIVRYAVDEPYAAVGTSLAMDLHSAAITPEQPLRVRARVWPRAHQQPPTRLSVVVLREGAVVRTQDISAPQGGSEGRFAAEIGPLPEGRYEVRVELPAAAPGGGEQLSLPLVVRSDLEEEMRDLSGDRNLLEALAEASGGRCLNLDQFHLLPALLEEATAQRPRTRELPLWQSAYLFLFVLGCLSAEWALRKIAGLA